MQRTPVKPPNGSFVPPIPGKYEALCDKGPWHGRWFTGDHFRFDLMEQINDKRTRYLGRYVYQFGIWVWQGR